MINMARVDFHFCGEEYNTVYRICFERYVRAIKFELGTANELGHKTEEIFFYLNVACGDRLE